MLTAGQAQEHIVHTLGRTMSSEVSPMTVINLAGKHLCSMHAWAWLELRSATVAVESGLGFIRLPRDLSALHTVRGTASDARNILLSGSDVVHALRLSSAQAYPWRGGILRRVMPAANLLRYSESPSQTDAWSYSEGTGTVTDNVAINPFNGNTDRATVTDDDATATATLTQAIPAHLLKDNTAYTVGVTLSPYPITTATPPKTGILVSTPSPGSGGRQTLLEVQWGSTPWQDAPTATVIGTNSGEGTALDPIPAGEGAWTFPISAYVHQTDVNYGTMQVSIQPSRAAWSAASGSEDVTQTGTVSFIRTQANEGNLLFDYELGDGTINVPKRLEPVLEVEPVPLETDEDALSILYSGFWSDAEEDSDDLSLPSEGFCDTLYLQIVRAFGRGWEEERTGSLDARMAAIAAGPVCLAAKQFDGRLQSNYSQVRNTAWDMASRPSRHADFEVSFSNTSPTSA